MISPDVKSVSSPSEESGKTRNSEERIEKNKERVRAASKNNVTDYEEIMKVANWMRLAVK